MADEIKNLDQAITDATSAFVTLKQGFADSSAQKTAQITDLTAQGAAKDTQIADLQAQIVVLQGSAISAAEVSAETAKVQALTADIAGTSTT